jgi:hypothetical protein
MSRVPWSRRTMLLNSLLFYPAVFLGGYVLWGKSAIMFWVYAAVWLAVIVLGRYFVCRRCKYYGVDCPSFGYSYLARMFRKDETKPFSGLACHIDIFVQVLVMLLPVLAWIFGAFDIVVSRYDTIDHVLMGTYVALALSMLGVHTAAGCNRCDIAECRLSKAARESKSKPQ